MCVRGPTRGICALFGRAASTSSGFYESSVPAKGEARETRRMPAPRRGPLVAVQRRATRLPASGEKEGKPQDRIRRHHRHHRFSVPNLSPRLDSHQTRQENQARQTRARCWLRRWRRHFRKMMMRTPAVVLVAPATLRRRARRVVRCARCRAAARGGAGIRLAAMHPCRRRQRRRRKRRFGAAPAAAPRATAARRTSGRTGGATRASAKPRPGQQRAAAQREASPDTQRQAMSNAV
jgi:hypothetical protein